MADQPVIPETQNFQVIGTRPARHDGVDKVTGRAKYGADYTFPGMLHGRVLRSPHAHALIKSINYDAALKLPGVFAVITGADLPELASKAEQVGEGAVNSREFNTAMVHQGYVEPHNAVGIYNADGHATIYCSTQGTFNVRALTAQVLKMPESNIKVVPAEIGAGFGGKLVIARTAIGLAFEEDRPPREIGHE